MLLILSASSLQKRLKSTGPKGMALWDLPVFAREQLGLFGLSLPTAMLTGLDGKAVDRLRDAADKAACPCLVLVESDPQVMGSNEEATEASIERMLRVLQVAHRLGCNSTALRIEAKDNEDNLEGASDAVKILLERADRMEINILIAPHTGLTDTPKKATALIKKIGGFRIGSMPDFQAAAASAGGDPREYLRHITPYAQAVVATVGSFDEAGRHEGYDLGACIEAISGVGFEGALAIEHKGKGDAEESVLRAREALESALKTAEA